ncbi:MAG: chemotaxis protein CheW [Candidatus Thiodiazotropha sp. (ex Dulcina madagascariensis)]|nr:chemotaxis protein CheW [Candidatus Thiodiazotropha sp. (ex Dulcina madagascariensis)]MCU7927454.1 chemotaxis protein CheW [Candidatus Thiodiazotropha sp. (ex Dulcina madagascariensis)]
MNQTVVEEVRSVLIPLHEQRLLLPNAVIAEVMDYQQPEPADDAPAWFLGNLAWRGVMMPVVSFEGMRGERVVIPGQRGRILIINALSGDERLSHIGLVLQSIPSLVRVSAENVLPVNPEEDDPDPLVKQPVELDLSPAIIPDLDEIESRVLDVVVKLR